MKCLKCGIDKEIFKLVNREDNNTVVLLYKCPMCNAISTKITDASKIIPIKDDDENIIGYYHIEDK